MNFNGERARPFPNSDIFDFVCKSINSKYLYDDKILPKFLNTYFEFKLGN